MRKKLLILVLSVIIAVGALGSLSGCHFVSQDETAVLRQVVAVVQNPHVTDPNDPNFERVITRFDLISAINQQAQGQQIMLTEQFINHVLGQLIDGEFMQMELERAFEFYSGNPSRYDYRPMLTFRDGQQDTNARRQEWAFDSSADNWIWRDIAGDASVHGDAYNNGFVYYLTDYTDTNEFRRAIFDTIDNQLRAERRRIQIEFESDIEDDSDLPPPLEPSPEFPIRDPEPSVRYEREAELWCPSTHDPSRIPGQRQADQATLDLEQQALRRFINSAVRFVRTHPLPYNTARLNADLRAFDAYFARADFRGLYLFLGSMSSNNGEIMESYVMERIAGENIFNQIRQQILHTYLTADVEVSNADVVGRFNQQRDLQVAQFRANPAAYASAVSGNQRILYRPNADFFYVKHVLLPFSEEQTDRLAAFRRRPGVTHADITHFRDVGLVNEIEVFARRPDGFNDYSRTWTARQVLDYIVSEVNGRSGSLREADRRFTDFIYMFNTDPGAFTHHLGYAMPTDANTPSGMVPEFELGGRDLLESYQNRRPVGLNNFYYRPGKVLNRFATSDFGVHIMFFANTTTAGYTAQLNSFETPGELNTWEEIFRDEITQMREATQMRDWANNAVLHARHMANPLYGYGQPNHVRVTVFAGTYVEQQNVRRNVVDSMYQIFPRTFRDLIMD